MRQPIKDHLVNRSKPAGIPFQTGYTCDFKFGFEFKPAGKPVRTGWTEFFEFKFEFDRFLPVTGPIYQNRSAPVWGYRLGKKPWSLQVFLG